MMESTSKEGISCVEISMPYLTRRTIWSVICGPIPCGGHHKAGVQPVPIS